MDPNAALEFLLEAAKEINEERDAASDDEEASPEPHGPTDREMEMAERIEALDEWIRRGGFFPERWQMGKRRK